MAIFKIEIKDEDLKKLRHKGYGDEEVAMLIVRGIPIAFSGVAEQLEAKKEGGKIGVDEPGFDKWLGDLP